MSQEFRPLADRSLLSTTQGTLAFGIYRIQQHRGSWQVWRREIPVGSFRWSSTALAWCVADRYQDHVLAIRVRYLDQAQALLVDDVDVRARLAQKHLDPARRDLAQDRMQGRQHSLRAQQHQLDICLARAKYLYIRGLSDETTRIGRPPPYRKNT